MKQGHAYTWIADGEKYALLGLAVKVTDPNIGKLNLAPHFRIIGESDFTIRMNSGSGSAASASKKSRPCDLFIAAKVRSATPDVLDGENVLLSNRVWGFYRGLLLSSTFATAHKPLC
jgi:hypothetical protein